MRQGRQYTLLRRPRPQVTGIDFLKHSVAEAKGKAPTRGLIAAFLVMDALRLNDIAEVSDSVIECGLFHIFSDENRNNATSMDKTASVLNKMPKSTQPKADANPHEVWQVETKQIGRSASVTS